MKNTSSDKRQQIITATIKLIAAYGFHGTPISMIAQEAGVGAGTIYRYFKDKDALVLDIFQQVDTVFKQTLLAEYDDSLPLRDRFLHICRGVFHYGIQNPNEFKFIEQFYHSPYGTNLRREKLFCSGGNSGQELPLQQIFTLGQAQGEIRHLPFFALLALALGPIIFLVKDSIAGLIKVDAPIIDQTVAACWDAVKLTDNTL